MTTVPPVPEPEPTEAAALPTSHSPTPAGARQRPAWQVPTATGVAGLVLGAALMAGVMSIRAGGGQPSLLSDAVEACGLTSVTGIRLADEGRSVTFDMKGEDDATGAGIVDIACLFGELDMPSAVMSHIDQTTSMDGRQTETWGDLTISWSYHPRRGLDGVLTVTDD